MKRKFQTILIIAALISVGLNDRMSFAQDETNESEPSLSTLVSFKFSAGYGFGRARQLYGIDASQNLYWSAGQGAKMDLGICIPLLPIDVVNLDGPDFGPERYPVVGLELELASGYHISTGGTTNDPLSNSSNFMTTRRKHSYVPVTLGFNARAALGAGLPSVFVGAGGGINIPAIYEDEISFSNSKLTYKRTYSPPIPFRMYGTIGVEIPLLYSADDGNSLIDLFIQGRLEEVTNYIYDFRLEGSDGTNSVIHPEDDALLLHPLDNNRSASSASLSLGFKINIY
jgi:hypothetical protein